MSGVTTPENDAPETGDPGTGAAAEGPPTVADLRAEAVLLVAALPASVLRVRVASGSAVVEVDWAPVDGAAVPVAAVPVMGPAVDGTVPAIVTAAVPSTAVPSTAAPSTAAPAVARHRVTAPLVGTVYRRPAPGEPPFVDVGDVVEPGRQVAIVEAMKLMNEITTEHGGTVVAIPVEDGEMVEYGQVLVELDPTGNEG